MGTSLCTTAVTLTSGGGAAGAAAFPPQPTKKKTTERATVLRSAAGPTVWVELRLWSRRLWWEGEPMGLGPASSSDMNTPCTASKGIALPNFDGWHPPSSKMGSPHGAQRYPQNRAGFRFCRQSPLDVNGAKVDTKERQGWVVNLSSKSYVIRVMPLLFDDKYWSGIQLLCRSRPRLHRSIAKVIDGQFRNDETEAHR